ncbi:cache domain-containing sensor histidine kinase [Cohnella nanjingensis]|uniref:histidine kinase n=1 Tax=Cohnella nanjingensis TaxID=1387779 RepID=A0A7X0RSV6_9BACL|nr:sensor histidine kinase [Cohnella nanjingensis]MBB6673094.1 sensor histidine kinase [Cohnella nanjingensis]
MIEWFRRSLKRKISILLLVSILFPLLSLGFFSYVMASNLTEEKAKQSGMSVLRQLGTNLEFTMRDIENMSLFLIGNKDVQLYLRSPEEEAAMQQTRMIEFISNLTYSKNYISDMTIYPDSGAVPVSSTTIFATDLPDITRTQPEYFEAHPSWWTPLYRSSTAAGQKRVISLVRPIRNLNSFRPLGKLVISLDESVVARMLQRSGIEGGGYLLLADAEGHVLSGSMERLPATLDEVLPGLPPIEEAEGAVDYNQGPRRLTVLFRSLPMADWTLIEAIPAAEYKAQNRYVLALTAGAVGVALLAIAALVIFFVQRMTRPLRMLTDFLKNTDPEKPMQIYPVESMDEVGQLVRSYNKLGGRIERLTEQVKLTEAARTEADMLALQAQINPHFLYNTLSSIHWMALMKQEHDIAEMVGNLSDFLRFSLNQGAQFCTVEQEIAHVRHYANIQAIRYPDQFEILFAVDPELNGKTMLKLLLQPLIENALAHGVQKKAGKGTISVHASLQGALMTFAVEDTGIGIEPDKLQRIVARLNEPEAPDLTARDHYGLRNVHQRLLLHYGADAGLLIESTAGAGTRVSFTLPVTEGSPT